jgi:predicted NodU family carbamoyl transferase
MMQIHCEVSLGELVDKLTILEIKMERIGDQQKVELAAYEHQRLSDELDKQRLDGLSTLRQELKTINEKLWTIEDDIREKERRKSFDQEFIDLARSVYVTNDERFKIKNEINTKFNSGIKEVKSYKEY